MSAPQAPKLLTTKKLWAAFFVQLNEAYQITVLLPMTVFMCRDFGISPNMLGVYTSFLNASFMFCQFLVSYLWGSFSDRMGRRIALVLGLIFSTIGVLTFGFATSYIHAMVARCLCGLFNGNLGVIKAWLSDISDSSNRSFAFSIIAISFGLGNVLGSMMGGLLIETHNVDLPDDEYKPTVGVLDFWIFREQFPFLLPCVFGAVVSGNALIWTLWQVRNENQAKLTKRLTSNIGPDASMGYANGGSMYDDDDRDSNLSSILDGYHVAEGANSDIGIFDTAVSIYQTNNSCSLPMLLEGFTNYHHDKQKHPLLLKTIGQETDRFDEQSTRKKRKTGQIDGDDEDDLGIHSLSDLLQKTDLIKTLFCYVIIAICVMMFREMNPVYMAQALLFNSQFIGYVQAWSGFNLLSFTFFFQRYFLRTFQHRNMGVFNSVCLALTIVLMPSIYWTLFVDALNKQWITLVLCFMCETLMVVFASILFVISMCFINNSVPPQHCGKANGLAQSCASLVRAIGPILTGFIWSESVQYIDTARYTVYWAYVPSFIGFLTMGFHMYCFIKPEYQFCWEEQLKMKKEELNK